MKIRNGLWRLVGFKLHFATVLLVTFVGSIANADIVISNTAIVIDNKTILASEITSIVISNGVLNINVPGWSVERTGSTTPGTVVINFTVTPTSIETGQSATLNWNTTNAISCEASGSWSGARATSGSEPVTPGVGTHTYSLTCSGSSSTSAPESVLLTVSDPAGPVVSPDPIPTNCPQPSLSGSVVTWADFSGQNFPHPNGLDTRFEIGSSGEYVAIKFNLGDLKALGSISLTETTSSGGSRLGAISECPGNFSVQPVCQQVWGVTDFLRWGTIDHPSFCHLENNKDYYVNFSFTDGKDRSTSTCTSGTCVIRVISGFNAIQ